MNQSTNYFHIGTVFRNEMESPGEPADGRRQAFFAGNFGLYYCQ
jgi:hypothetical protein